MRPPTPTPASSRSPSGRCREQGLFLQGLRRQPQRYGLLAGRHVHRSHRHRHAQLDSNAANHTDSATLNQVLFFQPTPGQTLAWLESPVPQIPDKEVTITNNLTTTVYPFMRDAASTLDPLASPDNLPAGQKIFQGLYDPIDQLFEEYRGYIGYTLTAQNYLGLPPA